MTAVEDHRFIPQVSEEPYMRASSKAMNRVSSPASKLRSSLQESIHSSRVLRDLSPSRVYTSTPLNTTRTSLPDLFKQKNSLQLLRPPHGGDADMQDEGSKQPKLLSRLQALLDEKLELVERFGAAQKGFAGAQLRTDAYRQAYDAFLHSFTTYRSLLMRVKHEYDIALDDALAAVYDNVHMRAELSISDERMETAVQDAYDLAHADVASVRQEMQDQVAQETATLAECEKRSYAAEVAISQCHSNNSKLRAELQQLRAQNQQLKRQLVMSSSWNRPGLLASYGEEPTAAPSEG